MTNIPLKDEKILIFSKAFEEAADGIQIVDLDGIIVYSNKAIQEIYGFSHAEFIGKHVNSMNVDQEFASKHILPSIMTTGRWTGELLVKHKNGTVFPIWLTTSMVTNNNGEPIAMLGLIKDITEQKQAEKVLKEQKELLTEQLLFSTAHNRIAEIILSESSTQGILENMAKVIGETLGIERLLIYDMDIKLNTCFRLFQWNQKAEPQLLPTSAKFRLNNLQNFITYTMKNKVWLESHIDDINPIVLQDSIGLGVHKNLGVQSLMNFPFSFRSEGFYLLTFQQLSFVRRWRAEEIHFIEAVAKQVEIAIQKIRFMEERLTSEQVIWEEKERAQVTLESIGDAVITTDELGNIEYLNPVAEDITGWTSDEAKGLPLPQIFRIFNEFTGEIAENPVDRCLREDQIVGLANHTQLLNRNGHKFPIEDSASPIKNREGKIIGAILVFHDVSEKRILLDQMTYQAFHDPLTGLPNRSLFKDRLNLALAQARRNNDMLAVLFLDLDRFKLVNDMLGHAVGDKLLKDVARRLSGCVRQSDTIARLGGDEFTILLPQPKDAGDVVKFARKILNTFQKPWIHGGQEFHITTSVGIAIYPNDGKNGETLLKHADTAMYRAKDEGSNNYQLYTPTMNAKVVERLTLENGLRRGLKRQEFVLHYQPLINISNSEIIGMEALLRWQHPERGLLYPKEFISLAENTGIIISLGEWVLRKACTQNKAMQAAGLPPIRVTVNLSTLQFQQQRLVKTVKQVLEETGLEPQWLELEITESALMQDVEGAIRIIYELKRMGVLVSIDDFGTGYSSLNYLRRFPVDTLKIDRSFVQDITVTSEDAAIVSTIILLAKKLNMKVIAEGVESEEQLNFLKHNNCSEMQGFLFSLPLPAEEFERLLGEKTIG